MAIPPGAVTLISHGQPVVHPEAFEVSIADFPQVKATGNCRSPAEPSLIYP